MNSRKRVQPFRAVLEPLQDPLRAEAMQAYLRGQFLFLGLSAPVRRLAAKQIVNASHSREELLDTVEALWALPQREYRYTAIDLLGRWKKWLTAKDVPMLITLANREPWWETVDGLSGVISDVLWVDADKGVMDFPVMERALISDQMWSRRIAMTHQLGWRNHTNPDRLFRYALTLADENEFFIRKAIGWALRDYARSAPKAVKAFIKKEGRVLSPLSIREAIKRLE